MILHYLKISVRNILKYKTQTVINVCSIAVSMMLLSVIASMLLTIKPLSILRQPYSDRIVKLRSSDPNSLVLGEDLSQLVGRQLKCASAIHYFELSGRAVMVSANLTDTDEKRSLLSESMPTDAGFFPFYGERSAYSGNVLEDISDNDVVITQPLAEKLFKEKNPIGESLYVVSYVGDSQSEKRYRIKDVVNFSANNIFGRTQQIYLKKTDIQPNDCFEVFILLKEGYSSENLEKELNERFENLKVRLTTIADMYDDTMTILIRDGVILFLFLFLCVSFSGYLRQQIQLFRLREREIAVRTCCGGKPSGLFALFLCEVAIVLALSTLLAIILDCLLSDFIIDNYDKFIEEFKPEITTTVSITIIVALLLLLIGVIVILLTIRHIRKDQTCLAMRMKPRPSHRLRNVGITVQLAVSILFIWVTLYFLFRIDSIKAEKGIPDDVYRYESCLWVNPNASTPDDMRNIAERIRGIKNVDRIFRFYYMMDVYEIEDKDDIMERYNTFKEYHQTKDDVEKFFEVKVTEFEGDVNPNRNVVVSDSFREMLERNGRWNGKTVRLGDEDYEIRGTYDRLPFEEPQDMSIIITDQDSYSDMYDIIVLPERGEVERVRIAVDDAIREVMPDRVDVGSERYIQFLATKYIVIKVMMSIIFILSIVSIVSTVATIYGSVSLDTRRRRKEMALRKLNGANRKVIGRIFIRTYMVIMSVAIAITLPLCALINNYLWCMLPFIPNSGTLWILTYLLGVILTLVVVAVTIAWKIRAVMRVDPAEYLKD